MPTQTELRTDLINTLAGEAAESAVDMAGADLDLLPNAEAALAFITNMRYEEETDAELLVLSPHEVTNFRHACRHLRNRNVPTDLAIDRSFEK